MPGHDIIVIGASAGGIEAMRKLVRGLPADFPAAIFLVVHISENGTSVLPQILTRGGCLKAVHPQSGQVIEPGHIYVAPPNHHLLIKFDRIILGFGPRENNHRPAIDPLFRTAARYHGSRVIGVVLSGTLDDGTAGLGTIKRQGGITVVQDPKDALFSGMPDSAIEHVPIDYILPIADIPSILSDLVEVPVSEENQPISKEMEVECDIAELKVEALQEAERPGSPSGFGCPDCGGSLWELSDNNFLRFRCRIGHAYSAKTLLSNQSDTLEDALWVALRALEEKAALSQKLGKKARDRNHTISATHFEEQAEEAQERANLIRNTLLNQGN